MQARKQLEEAKKATSPEEAGRGILAKIDMFYQIVFKILARCWPVLGCGNEVRRLSTFLQS